MLHLHNAHSDILREALPNRGIFGHSLLYRMGIHDNLDCVLNMSTAELQLELVAHRRTLWRSAIGLCSCWNYRYFYRYSHPRLTAINDLEASTTNRH